MNGCISHNAARCGTRRVRRALRSLPPNKPTNLPNRTPLRDANRPPRIARNHLPTRGISEQVEVLHGNRTEENLVTKHHAPDVAFPISDPDTDRPDIRRLHFGPVGKRHSSESLERQFELPRDRFGDAEMQGPGIHQRRSMHRRDLGSRIAKNQIDVHESHVSTPNGRIVEPENYT